MNLYKSFSLYTIGSFIEKGISFFLMPIFTFYLSTRDFGILALVTSVISFMVPIIGLGISGAISVAYFNGDRKNYPSYFSSSILAPFIVSVFLSILVYLFKGPIQAYFEVPFFWLLVIPFFCFFSFINSMLLIDYQIKDEPMNYITYSLGNTILNFIISLGLIYFFKFGFEGRLIGQYFSVFFFFLIALYILKKKRNLLVKEVSWVNAKDSLSFGLPLVPHLIGGLILNISDRLFIDHFCGKELLGIYNIAYVLGSVISIFGSAFVNAITPFSFKLFSENTRESLIKVVKMYWAFIFFMVLIVFGIYLLTPIIFKYFIDPKFYEGTKYIIWITLGYFFQGIYFLFVNVIFYLKKTKILFYFSIFNIVLNLSLNYFLIRLLGPIGAAYATCISFFIFCFTIAIYSNSIFPLPWLSIFIKKEVK
jgi:O-antigen/teichoic acid export membrane protein